MFAPDRVTELEQENSRMYAELSTLRAELDRVRESGRRLLKACTNDCDPDEYIAALKGLSSLVGPDDIQESGDE